MEKIGSLLLKILVQIMSVILYLAKKILYGQYFGCTSGFQLDEVVFPKADAC